MIRESKANGKYLETEDNTQKYLKTFPNVLARTLKSTPFRCKTAKTTLLKLPRTLLTALTREPSN